MECDWEQSDFVNSLNEVLASYYEFLKYMKRKTRQKTLDSYFKKAHYPQSGLSSVDDPQPGLALKLSSATVELINTVTQ